MHIIGGKFYKRGLLFPKNLAQIRPTKAVVREAVFDMLSQTPFDPFLDLYAGTGAMGIEALSRGAEKAVFVDTQTFYISKNLQQFDLQMPIIKKNVSQAHPWLIKKNESFEVIWMDPPYHDQKATDIFNLYFFSELLKPGGLLFWEHDPHFKHEKETVHFCVKQRKYGSTILSVFRKEQN